MTSFLNIINILYRYKYIIIVTVESLKLIAIEFLQLELFLSLVTGMPVNCLDVWFHFTLFIYSVLLKTKWLKRFITLITKLKGNTIKIKRYQLTLALKPCQNRVFVYKRPKDRSIKWSR
jgi:hypothetical protein